MRQGIAAIVLMATVGVFAGCGNDGSGFTEASSDKQQASEWVREACPAMRNLRQSREQNIKRAEQAIADGEEVAYAKKLIRLSRQAISREVEDCKLELESRRKPEPPIR